MLHKHSLSRFVEIYSHIFYFTLTNRSTVISHVNLTNVLNKSGIVVLINFEGIVLIIRTEKIFN